MSQLIPVSQKNPNPQGKGCVAVLQDWAVMCPQRPERKIGSEVLRDYCLSALVVAAKFRFRPVRGKAYYLYSDEQDWTLSLIGPQEWGAGAPGQFVADCRLQADMTWQLEFSELAPDSPVLRRLECFVDGFSTTISRQESLVEGLPFYVRTLPYYQRMLATGLAVSLQHSLGQADVLIQGQQQLKLFDKPVA